MHPTLETSWPFLVLVSVLSMGFTLFRPTKPLSVKVNDPAWWMQLGLPLYMLHQFEEYGVDLKGRHFRFQETLCGNLGFPSLPSCPIKPWHATYVNLLLVSLSALRARRAGSLPSAGANFYGVVLINRLFHLAMAVHAAQEDGKEVYNPGLATAVFLFLPCAVMALQCLHRHRLLSTAGVVRSIAVGVAVHAGLFSGLILRSRGKMGDAAFVLWELADWTVPLTLGWP
ncbi:hypothetical protein JCM6882_007486 [Rhodosporidiobolus microsporus]